MEFFKYQLFRLESTLGIDLYVILEIVKILKRKRLFSPSRATGIINCLRLIKLLYIVMDFFITSQQKSRNIDETCVFLH